MLWRICSKRLFALSPVCPPSCLSFLRLNRPSVRRDNSASTGGIFIKLDTEVFIEKSVGENPGLIKIWEERRLLYINTSGRLWYFAEFFLKWEMFCTKGVEKIKKKSFYLQKPFPPKFLFLWHNVEKYCTVRQTTDGLYKEAVAIFISDKQGKTADAHL